jgi:tetratricopeptide (TPR) repeat protein
MIREETNIYAKNSNKKRALIIAISDYSLSGLKSIEFCKNDGQEMYDVMNKLGYDIPDNRKLIGYVDSKELKNAIYDFFTNEDNKPDDTLIFYYSGHGVPDKWGKTFLAPSDIDSEHPFMTGFSFDDLTDSMLACNSLSVVTILDSCFSGSLKISKGLDSKGGEEAATRIANKIVDEKAEKLRQGVGRCLLAASQGYEEAYDRQEKDHSIFTYYLLEGLKGHKNAVDEEGNVTYDTIGKFITREIANLPLDKRPKQTPIRKGEVAGGEIILANYPNLKIFKEDISMLIFEGNKYIYSENFLQAVEIYEEAIKKNTNSYAAHSSKGYALLKLNRYEEAIKSYDEALKINPKEVDALKCRGLALHNIRNYEEAIKSYDEALKINPNESKLWYYKGVSLFYLNRYINAIECYDRSIEINPTDNEALEQRGLALRKLGSQGIYSPSYIQPKQYEDVSLLLDEGLQFFENSDYESSIKFFDKAIDKNPNNPVSYNYKGDAHFKLKEYNNAIHCYDQALAINPNYLDVLKDKGLCCYSMEQYENAISCYDKALELNPKNGKIWYYKGMSLFKLNRNDESIKCIDESIRLNPNDNDIIKFRETVMPDDGKIKNQSQLNDIDSLLQDIDNVIASSMYEEALIRINKALEIYPNNLDIKANKGRTLILLGEYDEGAKLLDDNMQKDPTNLRTLEYMQIIFGDLLKDYDNALKYINRALEVSPNNSLFLNKKGLMLYHQGKYQEAIYWYDKALEVEPKSENVLNNKGLALQDLGKYQEAIYWYDKALEINPKYSTTLGNKGILLVTVGNYKEAMEFADKALEVEPDNLEFLNLNALICQTIGEYEKVNNICDKILEIEPKNTTALNYKGIYCYRNGKYQEAIDYYDKALEIEPKDVDYLNNKGLALQDLGKYQEAIYWYDKALEVDPQNKNALEYKNNAVNLSKKKKFGIF